MENLTSVAQHKSRQISYVGIMIRMMMIMMMVIIVMIFVGFM